MTSEGKRTAFDNVDCWARLPALPSCLTWEADLGLTFPFVQRTAYSQTGLCSLRSQSGNSNDRKFFAYMGIMENKMETTTLNPKPYIASGKKNRILGQSRTSSLRPEVGGTGKFPHAAF